MPELSPFCGNRHDMLAPIVVGLWLPYVLVGQLPAATRLHRRSVPPWAPYNRPTCRANVTRQIIVGPADRIGTEPNHHASIPRIAYRESAFIGRSGRAHLFAR